jgi:hypothetical protein
MSPIKTFMFGCGWATAWYLIHYLLLWPLWGFYAYFRDFKPGAGPQGGEAVVALMILYVLAIIGVAAINGVIFAVVVKAAWWKRILLWPLGLVSISACAAIVALLFIMDFAPASNGIGGRVTAIIGAAVCGALFLGANFWTLARIRGNRGSGLSVTQ